MFVELADSDFRWSCFLFGRLASEGIPVQTKQRGPNEQFYVSPRDLQDAADVKERAWQDYEELRSANELAKARQHLAGGKTK